MGFMDEGQAAFRAGRAAMTIDGTFRIGSFKTIKDFEWGVAELPANAEGMRSNYASYWTNAITAKAKGEKLEAAKKFLAFVSSPRRWNYGSTRSASCRPGARWLRSRNT